MKQKIYNLIYVMGVLVMFIMVTFDLDHLFVGIGGKVFGVIMLAWAMYIWARAALEF